MKKHTTQKTIKNQFDKIIKIGYCNLQFLLRFQNPSYYTYNGQYGWGSDVFIINDIAISTGYAPFGNIKPDYDLQRAYDIRAKKICETVYDYTTQKEMVDALLMEFINEVTK